MSKDEVIHYAFRVKSITQRHYEFVFPQLHILIDDLINQLKSGKEYQPTLNKITYQVSLDYEILKKSLGYPSQSAYKIFKRKTMKEKIRSLLGWIIFFYMISVVFVSSFFSYKFYGLLLFLYLCGFLILVRIGIMANNMKD